MPYVLKSVSLKSHQAKWIDNQPRSWKFSQFVQNCIDSEIKKEISTKNLKRDEEIGTTA